MGHYHRVYFHFKLDETKTDELVNEYLECLFNYTLEDEIHLVKLKEKFKCPLFDNERWDFIFSYTHYDNYNHFRYKKENIYNIISCFKCYNDIIEQFVDFIKPYLDESFDNVIFTDYLDFELYMVDVKQFIRMVDNEHIK